MKTTITNLVLILAVGAATLATTNALACGGGSYKFGYGGGYGGYHNSYNKVYVKKVYVEPVVVAPCNYPLHCFAFVYPGDTWLSLSQREFGRPNFGPSIAAFNGLSTNVQLIVGQQLRLPVIHPNGSLTASSAPAPAPFVVPSQPVVTGLPPVSQNLVMAPQGQPMGNPGMSFAPQGPMNIPQSLPMNFGSGSPAPQDQNFAPMNGPVTAPQGLPTIPAANVRMINDEASLPKVTIGSTLVLDGQLLGNDKGIVRLRINGMALPVEVLEWSISSAKIRLPEIELAGATKAEIEILRADGNLASKSAIELTPAATRLALGN